MGLRRRSSVSNISAQMDLPIAPVGTCIGTGFGSGVQTLGAG